MKVFLSWVLWIKSMLSCKFYTLNLKIDSTCSSDLFVDVVELNHACFCFRLWHKGRELGVCLFCQNVCLQGIVLYISLCPGGGGLVCCCLPTAWLIPLRGVKGPGREKRCPDHLVRAEVFLRRGWGLFLVFIPR